MLDLMYRPMPPAPPAVAPQKCWRPIRRATACAAAVLLAFAGAANADTLTDIPGEASAGIADQIFQSDYVSAGAVAAFARNGEAVGTVESPDVDPLAADDDSANIFEPADLRGRELFNTVGALGGGGTNNVSARKPAAKSAASLSFWQPAAVSESDAGAESAAAAAAAMAAGTGPANVLIPLPAAAWSALSVMGGFGALAGVRKIRRRFR